jgi:hypothetical protein
MATPHLHRAGLSLDHGTRHFSTQTPNFKFAKVEAGRTERTEVSHFDLLLSPRPLAGVTTPLNQQGLPCSHHEWRSGRACVKIFKQFSPRTSSFGIPASSNLQQDKETQSVVAEVMTDLARQSAFEIFIMFHSH